MSTRTLAWPAVTGRLVWPPTVPLLRFASVGLAMAGVVVWVLSVGHIHPYTTGAAGLVTGLPPLWWAGLILVTAAVGVELARPQPRTPCIVVSLVALALVLHGTLPASEHIPRFDAAYNIAGFSEYLGRTGHTLPRVDARMSWFGLFAATGMASRAMQVGTLWFLRWAPLIFELMYLFPIKALANVTLRSSRAQWAALGIFLAGNWIDQDYFSPQAVGLLLYLVIVVVAVRAFGDRGLQPWPIKRMMSWPAYRSVTSVAVRALRLPYGAVPAERPADPSTPRTRAALLALVLTLATVVAVSHQASPVALCLVMLTLVVFGRTRLKTTFIFIGFVVFAWLSWGAKPYWQSHLQKIFGSVGQVGSTVNVSVTGRTVSSSLGRSLVEGGRVGAALVIWAGGALGVWCLWRRGRSLWSVVILSIAPVLIGGAVSYGGEIALRILLFSLAPVSILVAGIIDGPWLRRRTIYSFAMVAIVLLALFPLDRFGNESFEAFSPGDFASAVWVHAHVPVGSRIFLLSRDEPLPFAHVGDYKLSEMGAVVLGSAQDLQSFFPRTAGYVYMTRSQYEYGTVYVGLPHNWLTNFEHNLGELGFVHRVYANSTAAVYYISARPRPHGLVRPHSAKPPSTGQVPRPGATTPTTTTTRTTSTTRPETATPTTRARTSSTTRPPGRGHKPTPTTTVPTTSSTGPPGVTTVPSLVTPPTTTLPPPTTTTVPSPTTTTTAPPVTITVPATVPLPPSPLGTPP